MPYERWKRVKSHFELKKRAKKVNYKGEEKGNYILPLFPPAPYPRFHFETEYRWNYHSIDIHIDWVAHKYADGFHPAIEEFVKKIDTII